MGRDMLAILGELGVTEHTLNDDEKWAIQALGYVVLREAIPPEQVEALQGEFDAASDFSLRPDDPQNAEAGAARHTNLEYFSPVFDAAWSHPHHLAAVWEFLKRPFELFTINGRDPKPGQGEQGLHRDVKPTPDRRIQAVQSLWMLDEFELCNGATRIVPASHFLDDRFYDLPPDRKRPPHPGQVMLAGPPGTIVVFSTHLLHGGTRNVSGKRRRALHSTFVPADFQRDWQHRDWITTEMRARLSRAQHALLDVD